MTPNDKRVLSAVRSALVHGWDGFAPHGSRDWTAIRRLEAAGLIEYVGHGVCEDCDTPAHRRESREVPLYVVTREERG